jgi:hypothetical protein
MVNHFNATGPLAQVIWNTFAVKCSAAFLQAAFAFGFGVARADSRAEHNHQAPTVLNQFIASTVH